MKRLAKMVGITTLALLASGCNTTRGSNEFGGNIVGAGLGGLVGAQIGNGNGQIISAVIGALIGSQIGGHVGRDMDDGDRMEAGRSLSRTSVGRTHRWKNRDTGYQHKFEPGYKTYDRRTNQTCREYTHWVYMNGRKNEVNGVACLQPNGDWKTIRTQ